MKLAQAFSGVVLAASAVGCHGSHGNVGEGSRLLELTVSSGAAVSGVTDSASARQAALAQGFLGADACQGGLKGGEVVMFSTTLDLTTESGQASGVLVKQDGGVFFDQKAEYLYNGAQLLAPGVAGGANGGTFTDMMSSWEFTGYLGLVCQVAFDLNKSSPSPLYTTASAAIVDISGGTAGLSADYKGVLELTLERTTDQGSHAKLKVYLAKGFGPVALDYEESNTYNPVATYAGKDGEFRLYLNDKGGAASGSGPTASIAIQAQQQQCTASGGQWHGDWSQGQCVSAAQAASVQDQTKACTSAGGDWNGDWAYGSCYTAAMKAAYARCSSVGGSLQGSGQCLVKSASITTQDACTAASGTWWVYGNGGECWVAQGTASVGSSSTTAASTSTSTGT